jgi:large subunit ribosomal protein L21
MAMRRRANGRRFFDFCLVISYNYRSLYWSPDTTNTPTSPPASSHAGSFWRLPVHAIVESGGRQYRAEVGHLFSVEKLANEVGEQIVLHNVLLVADGDDIQVGQPTIPGASVIATVVEQYKGKKIFVWKYRPRKRYRRRQGHRQQYTRLRIDEIKFNGHEEQE